jgi:hypothetical protein
MMTSGAATLPSGSLDSLTFLTLPNSIRLTGYLSTTTFVSTLFQVSIVTITNKSSAIPKTF